MYTLDTDIVTLYFHHRGTQTGLVRRIQSADPTSLFISVVTAEELIQGAFALIRKEQQKSSGTVGYRLFQNALEDILSFQILPFR